MPIEARTDVRSTTRALGSSILERIGNTPLLRLDRLTAHLPGITILQMIYQQKAYEGDSKDHEFSATSMHEHWQSGLEDTRRTLMRRDWLELPEAGMGIVVHDVHRERDY